MALPCILIRLEDSSKLHSYIVQLNWFAILFIALRISSVHDFRVINARIWTRAPSQRKKFPSS